MNKAKFVEYLKNQRDRLSPEYHTPVEINSMLNVYDAILADLKSTAFDDVSDADDHVISIQSVIRELSARMDKLEESIQLSASNAHARDYWSARMAELGWFKEWVKGRLHLAKKEKYEQASEPEISSR